MTGTLDDRTAVVTGGARGIGRAIAEGLARDGARIVIGDTDLKGAQETASPHRGGGGNRPGPGPGRVRGKAGRGVLHPGDRPVRTPGYPGEQCGHLPHDPHPGHRGGRVGPDPGGQPQGHLPHEPRGLPHHEGAEIGQDHQHRLGRRQDRGTGGGRALLRIEGGRHLLHQVPGPASGPLQDQRECRVPRSHRHRDDRGLGR